MITLTALSGQGLPDFAKGLVRDVRVRWALAEAGLPYRTRLIPRDDLRTPEHLALQPFGQTPAIEEDGFTLFESGAIVLYVGERSEALLPADRQGRSRAVAWVCAGLNTLEPMVQQLGAIDLFHSGEGWAVQRRPMVEQMVQRRLSDLATRLGDREYLEDRFTAGDLVMATVLRILRHTELVTGDPILGPYLARCEARPAFQTALAEHLAVFEPA